MDRRTFAIRMAAGAAAMGPLAARAQQNILKTYVGFPPGPGGFDNVARIVGEAMQASGFNVLVENRVGAGGRIALQTLKSDAAAETSMILSSQSPLTIFPHIYSDLRFDPLKDFAPLSKGTSFDYALAVRADSPFHSANDYLNWARANSGRVLFGIPGNGTTPHFIAEAMFQRLGVSAQAVPYKGTAPLVQDLLGGQIPIIFDTLSAPLANHKAGKLRVLATAGSSRSRFVPEIPTLIETGVDLAIDGWCGYYASASMSTAQRARIGDAIVTALRRDTVRDRLALMGMVPAPTTSADLGAFHLKEYRFWEEVLKDSEFRKKVAS